MKKLILLTLGLVGLLAGGAFAGDYHTGLTLQCQECHVMHFSQTHGYNANGGGNFTALGTGPNEALLRNTVNELCLSCHDGQLWAPDVLAAPTGTPTNGREAGALNRDNTAPYFDATGHTLGSHDVAPGGTFTPGTHGLECVNCHQPHGRTLTIGGVVNNLYRNANVWVAGTPTAAFMTYAIGTNNTTKDIFERSAAMGGDHYSPTNVDFNEPSPTGSGYGTYCKQCHTNFHGSSTDANMNDGTGFIRHPTADANISGTTFSSKAYRLKVMSSTGNWGPTDGSAWVGAPTDLTPSCMTCHKGHGNQNAFGLIYATGTVAFGENGEAGALYRDLCRNCHTRGTPLP